MNDTTAAPQAASTPPYARVPVAAWGRRLSDAVRAALAAGDLAQALALVRAGDGQARRLAQEYTFMIRGLGITLHVLLRLLEEMTARGGTPAAAAVELTALLQRLHHGLAGAPASAPPGLGEAFARATRAVEAAEAAFADDQSRRALEIERALEAGDGARARALLDAKDRDGYLPLHDRLIRFMADAFAWVLRHFGPEELLRFHQATAEGQRAGFEKWERMPAAEFAWTSAFLLKQHMGRVAVREDAEKYTIEQTPCGSGGRLRLAGAYDGADALPFVEGPGALTFGEARVPVYCSHCAIWNGVATLQWFGRAHWVFDGPARADGGCRLHIYKRREDAPAQYARRLGVAPRAGR